MCVCIITTFMNNLTRDTINAYYMYLYLQVFIPCNSLLVASLPTFDFSFTIINTYLVQRAEYKQCSNSYKYDCEQKMEHNNVTCHAGSTFDVQQKALPTVDSAVFC